jgi:dienelactone hydrolase
MGWFRTCGIALLAAVAALALGAAPSAALTEFEELVTGAGSVSLAGTLALPSDAGRAKLPAVLLIQGSGPTDRNGNQRPNIATDLEKQLAEALARVGIASLRLDKRGMHANAADMPKDLAAATAFFTWDNTVEDAIAAWRWLEARPDIDSGRIAIFGHSEGGLAALVAAERLAQRGRAPAALVLAATPGRPLGDVIDDQLRQLLKRQGASSRVAATVLAANDGILAWIRKTGEVPARVPNELRALYPPYIGPFLAPLLRLDPAELAKRYAGPVLVVQGAEDIQISAERDAGALDAALGERPKDDHETIVAPSVSHNLKPVARPDEPGFWGSIAPAVLDPLVAWLAAKLEAAAPP